MNTLRTPSWLKSVAAERRYLPFALAGTLALSGCGKTGLSSGLVERAQPLKAAPLTHSEKAGQVLSESYNNGVLEVVYSVKYPRILLRVYEQCHGKDLIKTTMSTTVTGLHHYDDGENIDVHEMDKWCVDGELLPSAPLPRPRPAPLPKHQLNIPTGPFGTPA